MYTFSEVIFKFFSFALFLISSSIFFLYVLSIYLSVSIFSELFSWYVLICLVVFSINVFILVFVNLFINGYIIVNNIYTPITVFTYFLFFPSGKIISIIVAIITAKIIPCAHEFMNFIKF